MRCCTLLLALLFVLVTDGAAFAARRVALVVGNFEYRFVPRLTNAQNDARAIASLLREERFEVDEHHNLANADLRQAIRSFFAKAQDADVAVVYYAGHGVEVDGVNYIIPVDARLRADIDVEDEAISLERIMQVLEPARRLRLVILDACRDNPFLASMKRTVTTRAVARGLAKVEPSKPNTLVAFAAKAGSVAEDGHGSHSPFTEALLKHIAEPGLDIRLALGRVRDDVIEKTKNSQEPFVYGSLGGSVITLSIKLAVEIAQDGDDARKDFEIARKLETIDAWDAFLARHKQGYVAEMARKERDRLAALQSSAPASGGTTPAPEVTADESKLLTFEQADRKRVAEIAARHKLPMPEYEFVAPPADLDKNLRGFIGVWASVAGFNRVGPHSMIIVTNATKEGKVAGHFVIGPPTPGTRVRAPARILPINGTVTGDRLTFETPKASVEATLTALGSLDVNVSQDSGRRAQAELKPVWRMVAHHTFPIGTPGQATPRSKPAPATTRKLSAPSGTPDLDRHDDAPRRGRGGGRGGGRGAIVDSPRFPMCARLASERGLKTAGPDRRDFIRNCVLSG